MNRSIAVLALSLAGVAQAAPLEPWVFRTNGGRLEVRPEGFHAVLETGETLTGGYRRETLFRRKNPHTGSEVEYLGQASWRTVIAPGSAEQRVLASLANHAVTRVLKHPGDPATPMDALIIKNVLHLTNELGYLALRPMQTGEAPFLASLVPDASPAVPAPANAPSPATNAVQADPARSSGPAALDGSTATAPSLPAPLPSGDLASLPRPSPAQAPAPGPSTRVAIAALELRAIAALAESCERKAPRAVPDPGTLATFAPLVQTVAKVAASKVLQPQPVPVDPAASSSAGPATRAALDPGRGSASTAQAESTPGQPRTDAWMTQSKGIRILVQATGYSCHFPDGTVLMGGAGRQPILIVPGPQGKTFQVKERTAIKAALDRAPWKGAYPEIAAWALAKVGEGFGAKARDPNRLRALNLNALLKDIPGML